MGKGNDSAFRSSNASLRQLAQIFILVPFVFAIPVGGGGDEGNKNKRIKQTGRLRCSALTNVRLFKSKNHFSSSRELLAVTVDYFHHVLKRLHTYSKMISREMIDSKI